MNFTQQERSFYFSHFNKGLDVLVAYLLDGKYYESKMALCILHDRGYVGERVSKEKDEELACEIRKYLGVKEEQEKLEMVIGGIYTDESDRKYILSMVDYDLDNSEEFVCLVCIHDGNRYKNPMSISELQEFINKKSTCKFTYRPDLTITFE